MHKRDKNKLPWLKGLAGLLFAAAPAVASADAFYPVATAVPPGESGMISFILENSKEVRGLQTDITLPEGLTAVDFKLTDRGKGLTLSKRIDGNNCRVLAYGMNGDNFSGSGGALLEMEVKADTDYSGGTLSVSNTTLPTVGNGKLYVAPITTEIPTEGPVNVISVANIDITAGVDKEVSIILTNESEFAGFLFDVMLPQGISIKPESLTLTDRASKWNIIARTYDDGNTRIVGMFDGTDVLEKGSGVVLSFTLTATDQAPENSAMTIRGNFTEAETFAEIPFSFVSVPMTVTMVKVGEIKCANGEQNIQLEAGDAHTYNITVAPAEAYNKDLEWALTEGEGVVALTDGTVTALSVGKAVITVTAKDGGDASLTLNVEVIPTAVTGIEVKCEGAPEIMVDQTLQLTAELTPANATDRNVIWNSSDPDIAVVNEDGLVTGKGVGEAVITATGENDICGKLTVKVKPVPVDQLTLNVANLALQIGQTYPVRAIILPANATFKTLTWSSSDESVATVTPEGFIRALAVGETEVTATQEDNNVSASCILKVVGKNALSLGNVEDEGLPFSIIAGHETPVTVNLDNSTAFLGFQFNLDLPAEVTLVPESVNMERGNSKLLRYRDYGDGRVTFIYLNPDGFEPTKVETEDEATDENGKNESEQEETTFEHPDNINPGTGGLLTFKVVASDKAEADSMLTLSEALFTNADLAEVTLSDVEIPVRISVLKVDKITLTEKKEDGEEVELNAATKKMQGTESFTFTWDIEPALAYDKRIAVTSSNPELVAVAADNETTTCTVSALGIGTATITVAALDGGEAQATFTVEVMETAADGITVTPGEATLRATEILQLTAEVTPANTTDKSVSWTSSDSSVATVSDDGIVTAVAVGEATITANNSNDDTAEVKITVEPTPVSSIVLSEKHVVIHKYTEFTLEATIYPETATNQTYKWSSSDEKIASVDDSGNVQAIAQGEATITATALDGSGVLAECEVFVTGVNRVAFAGSDSEIPDCDEPLKIIEVAPYHESLAYVTLENEDAYSGFQLDIVMPEGTEILADSWRIVGHENEEGFIITGRSYPDGVTRLIGLIMGDSSGEGNNEEEDNVLFDSLEEGSVPANVISFIVVRSAVASEAPEADMASEGETYRDFEVRLENVSFVSTDAVEHALDDATGVIRLYDILPMRLRKVVSYSFGEQEQAWSKNGMTYSLYLTMEDDDEALMVENISVSLAPGDEGEWIEPTAEKPEGVWDANWDEWQALIGEDNYVDGFWEPEKVVISIEESNSADDGYEVNVMLPCSGRYTFGLESDRYRFEPLDETGGDFLVAYPSVKNFWTSESYKDESGSYLPLCLNIEGIPMKNDGEHLSEEWVMEYPFGDDVIWNHGNLHRSTVYPTGVYLAEMWTKAELNEGAGSRVRQEATAASLEDLGFIKGSTVNLSQLSTEDGKQPNKGYDVSIVLKKNGAMTPLESNGKSGEYFTVTSSQEFNMPTGIETIGCEVLEGDDLEIYTLGGYRMTPHPELLSPGIYLVRRGCKATKLVIR